MSSLNGQGGHYDLRRGVSSYAPIIGTVGALAVPAIILLFTLGAPHSHKTISLITFAAGLLMVATIASLIGAIGFAAIGAETEPTANIPAAVMFVGISAVICVVDILAAFAVLSAVYLPGSEELFAVIAGIGGITGVFFLSFSIGDSWHMGPRPKPKLWLDEQWIKSKEQAQFHAITGGLAGLIIIAIGMILRPVLSYRTPGPDFMNAIVLIGLGLAIVGTIVGNLYTSHPAEGIEASLRWQEAYGSIVTVSLYVTALLLVMPWS
jgi:hypothetical protein